MSARLGRIALAVALVVALWRLITVHYIDQGVQQERAVWQAREGQRERQAATDYSEAVRRGQEAAKAALTTEGNERNYADQLQQERRHAVLTVPHSASTSACAAGPGDHGPEPVAAGPGDRGTAEQAEPAAYGPLVSPGLTVGAVRLWNAALTGPSAAAGDAPAAGACGTADATPDACAAAAGISLAEAWDNQAANALSCRIDRDRYRTLIDFLQASSAAATNSKGNE